MGKKLAILTSGGDSPGMNCAIRAFVRYALFKGHEVVGIKRGYTGLLEKDFVNLDASAWNPWNSIYPFRRQSVSAGDGQDPVEEAL